MTLRAGQSWAGAFGCLTVPFEATDHVVLISTKELVILFITSIFQKEEK